MAGTIDLGGVALVITAIGGAIASVIAAVAALRLQRPVTELHAAVATNGDSRSLGTIATDVAAITSPDPHPEQAPDVTGGH